MPSLILLIVQSSVKSIQNASNMLRVIWTLVKMNVLAQREAISDEIRRLHVLTAGQLTITPTIACEASESP
jgi:hypothetical protein